MELQSSNWDQRRLHCDTQEPWWCSKTDPLFGVGWIRVELGFLCVVNLGSIRHWVIFGLFGVVLSAFGLVARGSVGCGVVNCRLRAVFRSNVVLRIIHCVVSRYYVVLGLHKCCFVARADRIWALRCSTLPLWWCNSWSFGVVARHSSSWKPRCKRLRKHTWWCSTPLPWCCSTPLPWCCSTQPLC